MIALRFGVVLLQGRLSTYDSPSNNFICYHVCYHVCYLTILLYFFYFSLTKTKGNK
nr:MAG TPA: hypothetical protein [Caudoviricetes sp.]